MARGRPGRHDRPGLRRHRRHPGHRPRHRRGLGRARRHAGAGLPPPRGWRERRPRATSRAPAAAAPGRRRRRPLVPALRPRGGRAIRARYPRLHVLVNNAGVIPRAPRDHRGRPGDAVRRQSSRLLPAHQPAARPAERQAPRRGSSTSRPARTRAAGSTSPTCRASGATIRCGSTAGPSWPTCCSPTSSRAGSARTGVTANCLHPGVVATQLLADYMNVPLVGGAIARRSAGSARAGRGDDRLPRRLAGSRRRDGPLLRRASGRPARRRPPTTRRSSSGSGRRAPASPRSPPRPHLDRSRSSGESPACPSTTTAAAPAAPSSSSWCARTPGSPAPSCQGRKLERLMSLTARPAGRREARRLQPSRPAARRRLLRRRMSLPQPLSPRLARLRAAPCRPPAGRRTTTRRSSGRPWPSCSCRRPTRCC